MKNFLLNITLATLLLMLYTQGVTAKNNSQEEEIKKLTDKAFVLYKDKNYVEAIDNFQQAYLLNNTNYRLLYSIAKAYDNLGNYDNARYYYNKTLENNPKHSSSLYNLGILDFNQDKIDIAEEEFKKAAQYNNKLSYAYYNLGNIYFSKEQYQAAIENYNLAFKLNSKLYNCLFNMAIIYKKTDQIDMALKFAKKFNDKVPNDKEATTFIQDLKNSKG